MFTIAQYKTFRQLKNAVKHGTLTLKCADFYCNEKILPVFRRPSWNFQTPATAMPPYFGSVGFAAISSWVQVR